MVDEMQYGTGGNDVVLLVYSVVLGYFAYKNLRDGHFIPRYGRHSDRITRKKKPIQFWLSTGLLGLLSFAGLGKYLSDLLHL